MEGLPEQKTQKARQEDCLTLIGAHGDEGEKSVTGRVLKKGQRKKERRKLGGKTPPR